MAVDNLCKTYGDGHKAIDDVSFRVRRGECFGLLGANGAGKSTVFSILSGQKYQTSGTVQWFDRNGVSYCPQSNALDMLLTVSETIHFYGTLRKVEDIEKVSNPFVFVRTILFQPKLLEWGFPMIHDHSQSKSWREICALASNRVLYIKLKMFRKVYGVERVSIFKLNPTHHISYSWIKISNSIVFDFCLPVNKAISPRFNSKQSMSNGINSAGACELLRLRTYK